MARSSRPPHDVYRVLEPGRIGGSALLGLAALVLSVVPLTQWVQDLAPAPTGPIHQANLAPMRATGELQLVVHIQDAGFFIEGADDALPPGERRIWCEAERCEQDDLRTLTERLARIKQAHPRSDHVVFVAGMTVPFGRVQAAMDAARSDDLSGATGQEPRWLFPRVTVQPDPLGTDRYLQRRSASASWI